MISKHWFADFGALYLHFASLTLLVRSDKCLNLFLEVQVHTVKPKSAKAVRWDHADV